MPSVANDEDATGTPELRKTVSKPIIVCGDLRNLPHGLRPLVEECRWVVWRYEHRPGKSKPWTKVPYVPNLPERKARSNDSSSWGNYGTACDAMTAGNFDGIGFMLHDSEFAAFDLDDCRDPDTACIAPWAIDLFRQADSYVEITVSGTGLRIIGLARGETVHRNQVVPDSNGGHIETYRRATRYIVITGMPLDGHGGRLANIDDLIDRTVARLDVDRQPNPSAHIPASNASVTGIDESNLPSDLLRLIQKGAPEGKRSEQFHRAVSWLKQHGWSQTNIQDIFVKHPDGIGAKFDGRLHQEIGRSFAKADVTFSTEVTRRQPQPAPVNVKATPFVWRDPAAIPRRLWLYGRHYIRRYMSSTIAPGGVGKTSLIITEAAAMASGHNLIGVEPAGRLRIWLWNGEDPREEIERRIAATSMQFNLTEADFEGHLFVDSGRDTEITIGQMREAGAAVMAPVVDAVVKTIRENRIDVVIIDPFVSSHRVTENDNNAIDLVAKTWARIADQTNTSIELVHHSRKIGNGEVTVEDARGASAMITAARAARVLNRMSKEEAEKAGVEQHRRYFRVDDGKANLAPPAEEREWYELKSIFLGNGVDAFDPGDNVGVVGRWKWPNPLDHVESVKDLAAVQQKISGGEWRANDQATDWAGLAVAEVLGLDIKEPAVRHSVKRLLRTWVANGVLKEEERKDATRRSRKYIIVGDRVE